MNLTKILLASHGTAGAIAAERLAIEICRENGAELQHLLVVPDFWKGMMGDDWLNNAVTQSRFGDYVENQLARDAAVEIERLTETCQKAGVKNISSVHLGKPAICLVEASRQNDPDMVIIGSPRPKGVAGYRSRMDLEVLARSLRAPLLIVPAPAS